MRCAAGVERQAGGGAERMRGGGACGMGWGRHALEGGWVGIHEAPWLYGAYKSPHPGTRGARRRRNPAASMHLTAPLPARRHAPQPGQQPGVPQRVAPQAAGVDAQRSGDGGQAGWVAPALRLLGPAVLSGSRSRPSWEGAAGMLRWAGLAFAVLPVPLRPLRPGPSHTLHPCQQACLPAATAPAGDGASGEVFAATWMGRRVAVKIFVKDRSPDGHSRDEMAISFSGGRGGWTGRQAVWCGAVGGVVRWVGGAVGGRAAARRGAWAPCPPGSALSWPAASSGTSPASRGCAHPAPGPLPLVRPRRLPAACPRAQCRSGTWCAWWHSCSPRWAW